MNMFPLTAAARRDLVAADYEETTIEDEIASLFEWYCDDDAIELLLERLAIIAAKLHQTITIGELRTLLHDHDVIEHRLIALGVQPVFIAPP